MAFCPQCGAEVKAGVKRCPSCGTRQEGTVPEVVEEVRNLVGKGEEKEQPPQRQVRVGDETTSVEIGQVTIRRGDEGGEYIPYCRKCGAYVARDVARRCPRCGSVPLCWRHFNEDRGLCAVCTPEAFTVPAAPPPAPPAPPPPAPPVPAAPAPPPTPPPQPAPTPPKAAPPRKPATLGRLLRSIAILAVVFAIAGGVIAVVSRAGKGEPSPGGDGFTPTPLVGGAGIIRLGETKSSSISPAGEEEKWTFSGTRGQVVTIRMAITGSSALDPYLELYDPQGRLETEDDDSGGDDNALIRRWTLRATGNYTIVAKTYDADTTGAYSITLSSGGTARGSISPGETKSGTIGTLGGADEWAFSGNQGQVVTIGMVATGSSALDPYLELYDPQGSLETEDDDSGGDGNALIGEWTLDSSGTYTIVAMAYGDDSTGAYSIKLSLGSVSAAQGKLSPGLTDPDTLPAGEETLIGLWVENTGPVAAAFMVVVSYPPTWTVEAADPVEIPSLSPGQEELLLFWTTPSSSSASGSIGFVLLACTPAGAGCQDWTTEVDKLERTFRVSFASTPTPTPAPLPQGKMGLSSLSPNPLVSGEAGSIYLEVVNGGSVAADFVVKVPTIPSGWSIKSSTGTNDFKLSLSAGASGLVQYIVVPPTVILPAATSVISATITFNLAACTPARAGCSNFTQLGDYPITVNVRGVRATPTPAPIPTRTPTPVPPGATYFVPAYTYQVINKDMAAFQTLGICLAVSGGNGTIYFSARDPAFNVSYTPQLITGSQCLKYTANMFGTHYFYLDNTSDSIAKTVVVSIQ